MQKRYWLFGLLMMALVACGESGGDTTPAPDNDDDLQPVDYENCLVAVGSQTLEVVTWNVENFPVIATAVERVEQIVEDFDADIIALQEIRSVSDFNAMVDALEGWSGQVVHVSGSSQRLAYLYKDSEITVLEQPVNLYAESTTENDDAFTSVRRPLYVKVQHSSGLILSLINVHLKCCDGSEDRRRSASQLIKTYIDDNLATENVIVLGDFNDEIVDASDNVFQNFIDDANNYEFATMEIAAGPDTEWSYPSWPSHIDQILITNELFDNEMSTQTLKLDQCFSEFTNTVSDHRPVMIRLSTN